MSARGVGRTLLVTLWRQGPWEALQTVVSAVQHTTVLLLFGLSGGGVEAAAEAERAPCRVATRKDVERLPAGELRPDSLSAFDGGDLCLVQERDGRLAGVVWASFQPVVRLAEGVHLTIPANTVYSYRTWTEDSFRGRGLQGQRHQAVLEEARARGRSRLLLFVDSTNFESRNGVRKSGCTLVGRIRVRHSHGDVRAALEILDQRWADVGPVRSSSPAGVE